MMSVHRAIPVDEGRARDTRSGERLSVASTLLVWLAMAGVIWGGIFGLLSVL